MLASKLLPEQEERNAQQLQDLLQEAQSQSVSQQAAHVQVALFVIGIALVLNEHSSSYS